MKRIIALICCFFFTGLATASAYPDYLNTATDQGVLCSQCHSDARTWAMFHAGGITSELVFFDAATASVHLPAISTAGGVYAADLVLVQSQPTIRFRVDNLQAAQAAVQVSATFASDTGSLLLPTISVGGHIYSVTLNFLPTPAGIQFDLLNLVDLTAGG